MTSRSRSLPAIALWLSISACAFWPSPSSSAPLSTDRYDRAIAASVERWWPDFPFPNAWKAQLYQESLLDPDAVSPAGARGIAQFMPATWLEVTRALALGTVSPNVAEIAIEAGAYYMATQRRFWRTERPQIERHRLAQASYNAGAGNIAAAQRKCGYARDWRDISPCLAQITGRHARETITYVERIARWWADLEAMQ